MIELQHLTKWFPSRQGRRYVFRDLSFAFPPDASIGLIGRNGAGKSTLMNLLGGIDSPNEGRIVTNARISWPVGLGGGFQTALTARENAQFVCRIYGAIGPRMRRAIAFVQEFADLGDYFDMPIRTYSSGMRSRLAFGLSMAFDFDYYLIDEVMAVGDEQFRAKSRAVLTERLKNARIVLVSHRMRDVREYCDKVVLVDAGQAQVFEDVEDGIAAYEHLLPPRPKRARRARTQ